MKLHVLLVGKPHDADAGLLHDRYAGRIRRLGAGYDTTWVPEVQAGARYTEEHAMAREARQLRVQLDRENRGTVIALDREGSPFDSRELARRLDRWARPRATFVIGGPLGLHGDLLARADERWSLSALTFPHELARVILAEQLYRALTLTKRLPYHK